MPNEKVKYFKEYNLIKDKIVYIKDRDLLGYDSSNSLAFQFRYWKMKKFGISDNIITMDDDYFIGGPLKKTDFFYIENGKVVPAIITPNFFSIDENTAKEKLSKYKKIILNKKEDQSSEMFEYSLYLTYLFFIQLYNKPIIVPKYTHNAMPINLKELKEGYDLIYNSIYRSTTLDSLYRHLESFQFQAFIFSYMFLQYNKKVKKVSYKYMNNINSILDNYNYSLLCINTGAKNNSKLSFLKSRIVMEYLFPEPTKYEIIDYSLSSISFKVMYLMQKEIISNNRKLKYIKNHKINFNNFLIFIFPFLIYILKIKYNANIKLIKKLKFNDEETIFIKDIYN